jgi:endonuclease/exonuclease/phosphatase family metal-dependent hydrolase
MKHRSWTAGLHASDHLPVFADIDEAAA